LARHLPESGVHPRLRGDGLGGPPHLGGALAQAAKLLLQPGVLRPEQAELLVDPTQLLRAGLAELTSLPRLLLRLVQLAPGLLELGPILLEFLGALPSRLDPGLRFLLRRGDLGLGLLERALQVLVGLGQLVAGDPPDQRSDSRDHCNDDPDRFHLVLLYAAVSISRWRRAS